MIRYPVDRIELEGLIDSHWNGWRPEATTRTNDLLAAGKYVKASPIWGRVKAVFMFLQHYKCAFCEYTGRAMGGQILGDPQRISCHPNTLR